MKTKRPSWFPLHFSSVCLLGALALGSCRPLFQRELRVPVLSRGQRTGNPAREFRRRNEKFVGASGRENHHCDRRTPRLAPRSRRNASL